MAHQRNTDGIKAAAQRKRVAALERTDAAIRELVKAGKAVNFTSVAEAANVSTAWLYEEADIKARIQQLREQGTPKAKSSQAKPRLSDASKDAIVTTLKGRIKTLEQRNRELSQQNEVFGGQVLRVRELEQQVKQLEVENATLRSTALNTTSIIATTPNTSSIKAELHSLGVQLNSTIQEVLREAPPDVVVAAMASLREARIAGRVENPSGFFYRAVTAAWKPNENHELRVEQNTFNEWFPLAEQLGLVRAATQIQNVQHVLDSEDRWLPWMDVLKQYPIEALQNQINQS